MTACGVTFRADLLPRSAEGLRARRHDVAGRCWRDAAGACNKKAVPIARFIRLHRAVDDVEASLPAHGCPWVQEQPFAAAGLSMERRLRSSQMNKWSAMPAATRSNVCTRAGGMSYSTANARNPFETPKLRCQACKTDVVADMKAGIRMCQASEVDRFGVDVETAIVDPRHPAFTHQTQVVCSAAPKLKKTSVLAASRSRPALQLVNRLAARRVLLVVGQVTALVSAPGVAMFER